MFEGSFGEWGERESEQVRVAYPGHPDTHDSPGQAFWEDSPSILEAWVVTLPFMRIKDPGKQTRAPRPIRCPRLCTAPQSVTCFTVRPGSMRSGKRQAVLPGTGRAAGWAHLGAHRQPPRHTPASSPFTPGTE